MFCIVWLIGGLIDYVSCLCFDVMFYCIMFLKLFLYMSASASTDIIVFDFYYDVERRVFVFWVEKIFIYYLFYENMLFFKIMIFIVDFVCIKYLVMLFFKVGMNIFIVGNVGAGKLMVVDFCFFELLEGYIGSRIIFSV